MDKFYFFKVILSYYNDDTEEFFITPEQDEADELGVPFSVSDLLQKTPEFKEFIKRNKAGIIDAEYIEYAVAVDSKNPITTPIAAEMFTEFEQLGALEIVDSNQIVVAAKSTSMGGGKMKLWCMIGAAAVALGVLAAAYALNREEKTETSNAAESTAVSEVVSDVSEDSAGGTISEIQPDTSDEISAETSADISDVTSDESSTETTETSTADSSEPAESSAAAVSSVNSKPVQTPPSSVPQNPAVSSVETDNSGAASKPVNEPDTSEGNNISDTGVPAETSGEAV